MTILGKKLPLIVISDDEDYDECKSGCSDNECDSDMCNVNWSLGHVKCFKHMKDQRGVACDTKTPCHRCRTRLSVDTNGAFRKHFLHCEKQRQQKSVQRDKSIPVDTVVIPGQYFISPFSVVSVMINTAILTQEEIKAINDIVETARKREQDRQNSFSSSNSKDSGKLVSFRST